MAFAACTGPHGPQGEVGSQGPAGQTGADGTDGTNGSPGLDGKTTGFIAGTVTVSGSTDFAAGASVSVNTLPAATVGSVGVDGTFSVEVPMGIYTVTLGSNPDDGFDPVTISNVVVNVGQTTILPDEALGRTNPLDVSFAEATLYQVGFGAQVQLPAATITGAPAGSTPAYSWSVTGGPSTVTLSVPTDAQPTFTTGKLADFIAAGKTDVVPPAFRAGALPIAGEQVKQMAYTFKLTVSAGAFSASSAVEVRPISAWPGNGVAPLNQRVMLASVDQAAYHWAITSAPQGSTAAIDFPADRYASFIPDVEGSYTITENGDPSSATTTTIVASTYSGANTCLMCHQTYTPRIAAVWPISPHADPFKDGINGVLGSDYDASCVRCHTTGYDPGADNGGFDEVQRQIGWTFPTVLQPGNYESAPAPIRDFGRVSCENCHGPGHQHTMVAIQVHNAGTGDYLIRKPFAANTCAVCHYEQTNYERFYEWQRNAHSDLALAMQEATVEGQGTAAANCGRCHSAQGFEMYVGQLNVGNSGNLALTTIDQLSSLGLNDEQVEPPSCQSCHDPHTTEPRLRDTILMLPAGFGVDGVGAGAVCMACHNSGKGRHEDSVALTSYSAPHTSSQTDVLMGRNAYFTTGVNVSAHAAAADTCANCHVLAKTTNIASLPAGYIEPGTNHTYIANGTTCSNCHASTVDGVALQAAYASGLGDLAAQVAATAWSKYMNREVTANGSIQQVFYNQATGLYSTKAVVDATVFPTTSSASFSIFPKIDEQMSICYSPSSAISVTWSDGSTTRETTVCSQLGSIYKADGTTAVFPKGATITKAMWNTYLLSGDRSYGVHNPSYYSLVIGNTEAALNGIP